MKTILTRFLLPSVALLCFVQGAMAQISEISQATAAFSGVEVSNAFELSLEKGESYSVQLSIDERLANYVQTVVVDNVLRIYVDENKFTPEVRKYYRSRTSRAPVMRVTVYAPTELHILNLKGESSLVRVGSGVLNPMQLSVSLGDDVALGDVGFDAIRMSLKLERRSSIKGTVRAQTLSLEAAGSAEINLTVEADEAEMSFSSNATSVFVCDNLGYLSVSSKGTSRTIFNGSVRQADYLISGSANVNAENMVCTDASVDMSGFCSLTESASGTLNIVNLSNGAKLVYKNAPAITIGSIRNSSVTKYYANDVDS